jgi:ubiquitin-protein ligase
MPTRRRHTRHSRRSRRHRHHSIRRMQYRQRGGNKALMKHIMDFNESKTHPGIYYYMDEENINHGFAMIVGPRYPIQADEDKKNAKYPYEEGLFFFEFNFPGDYPARPPNVKFLNSSIDPENLRIHPNLYEQMPGAAGKVCLSILGTWAGPGWKSTMNLESTLMTIQSILGQNPVQNEPGYETLADTNLITISYNHAVQHKSIEFSYNVFKMVAGDYAREKAARAEAGPRGGAGAPEENDYVEFESKLPPFIKPFYDELKARMWNSIQFYIQNKLDVMIDMHKADPPGIGKVITISDVHHRARIIDYANLLEQLTEFRIEIPAELRVSAAIENTSVTAAFNAAKAKAKDEKAAKNMEQILQNMKNMGQNAKAETKDEKAAKNMERREKILQNLKNMGQNTNANFIKEQNTHSLSNYLKTIQLQNYAQDNDEYVYENANN